MRFFELTSLQVTLPFCRHFGKLSEAKIDKMFPNQLFCFTVTSRAGHSERKAVHFITLAYSVGC